MARPRVLICSTRSSCSVISRGLAGVIPALDVLSSLPTSSRGWRMHASGV
jgi:hypothetical protein